MFGDQGRFFGTHFAHAPIHDLKASRNVGSAEPACLAAQAEIRTRRLVIRRSSPLEAESVASTVNAVHQQHKGVRPCLSVLCNLLILG
jgi:hypothetical protein